ncbi:LOW QUALITY PROTEIN: complement factor B [Dasypus novemcinctus]|uniref:LOW QUALITY PROTEIN: complement factor B n=1 Tax=Dasypus novemcinctus TaxID=9361 RepID=UPI00265F1801|nr:LOW QUALITY PROTEIN: complement factor B [Dasypus novemcinctus]
MDPLLTLLCLLVPGLAAAAPSCPRNVNISGGTFTLSRGWAPGSLLTYSCPVGRYPSPESRLCKSNGQWQTPRASPLARAVCKPVRCPAPVSFENGMYTPRLASHPVGGNLSFECEDGFTLRGSPVRRCRPNGVWDGETAVCENGAGHCPNPGTSVGAVRTGSRFGRGDTVRYRCSSNLVLTGSAERECQGNGVWSGTEPTCRQPYSYDFPEDVAPALGASLSHLLVATNPNQQKKENLGRKIQIQRSGHLNLYLLLDASQSVAEADFNIFKDSASIMVDRVFSFEINVSVAIITFASRPKVVLSVLVDASRDPSEVMTRLENANYRAHENGTGTNIFEALNSVHIMMNNQMERLGMHTAAWKEIRHAIILLTDGKSNMGGSPKPAVDSIKEILNINQKRKDYLDIYAIGVGKLNVDWKELSDLGSKKDGERHAFILRDAHALQQVFEHMLDVSKLTDAICGVGNMSANASDQERTPWHVTIKPKGQETCRGALVSDQWVLTAAHCFRNAEDLSLWRVIVGDPGSQWGKDFRIEKAVISPAFDVFAKKQQGILEFYGDDIALLKLPQKVTMSTHARPICLPCTTGANVALRRPQGSTCRDHERELLQTLSVPAHFVALNGSRLNINLKTGTEWESCIQAVSQHRAMFPNLTSVREVVTDQFLCSGTQTDDNPCKGGPEIRCPRPQDFENGEFWPRALYYNLSDEITFRCYDGYVLRGSANRTCQETGRWSGRTAVCDDGGEEGPRRARGYCPNPGIPIGTRKVGSQYRLEDSVTYHCSRGLTLRGSQQRKCLEGGSWSGTEPSCQDSFMYDTPQEVAEAFLSSLTETIEGADAEDGHSPGEQQKRKIVLDPSGSMNIYLVLDGSDSIGASNFTGAKKCLTSLIEKVASYGVKPRYGLVTYATYPSVLVRVSDPRSSNADWVTEKINKISYEDHKLKTGTNTKKALQAVYSMMNWQGDRAPDGWNRTRHVIILMTDGLHNMGGDPVVVIDEIRSLLDIGRDRKNPREDYLDVYVFGIGPLVEQTNINALASKKDKEQHVFKVKDMEHLEDVFYKMIDESQSLGLCGMVWEHKEATDAHKQPWQARISVTRPSKGHETCMGAVVSEYFVLTAAHCFTVDDQKHSIKVNLGGKKQDLEIEEVLFHPKYNINGKKDKGIPEFYDYDVALVKLKKKLVYSQTLRPICLPCTMGTTRALRLPQSTTCQQQKEELLPVKDVKALFVSDGEKALTRKEVYIKRGEKKASCERDALRAPGYDKVRDVSEVVTPRFLCTGGVLPYADPNTCKGDSGGPLIIHKRSRFIQVGVISWGVVDVCKQKKLQKHVPAHARDFHVNLFEVMPWLKEKLQDEDLGFL